MVFGLIGKTRVSKEGKEQGELEALDLREGLDRPLNFSLGQIRSRKPFKAIAGLSCKRPGDRNRMEGSEVTSSPRLSSGEAVCCSSVRESLKEVLLILA